MANAYMKRQLRRNVRTAARRGIRRSQRCAGRGPGYGGVGRNRTGSRGIWLWLLLVLGVVLIGAVISYVQDGGFGADPAQGHSEEAEAATVVRVVDGDTLVIELDGEEERVRLLNIDAPESVHPSRPVECMGPEASEHMESLVQPGDDVVLEFDQERTDQYDRLLAGVYADDVLLNEQMARDGFGHPTYYAPNERFLDLVEQAWAEAEAEGSGVFADDLPCEPELP